MSARAAALDVVLRVTDGGAYSNLTLASALDGHRLTGRDRALATELAYGTLRRLVQIDWVIGRFVRRMPRPRARAALRVGVYQLLFTRIPPHAAVAETVDLVDPGLRPFANAVLRRVDAEPPAWPTGEDDEAVSVRTGLSAWAVRELRRQRGGEAEAAATALASAAPLALRTNTCRTSVDELERALERAGIECERGAVHTETLMVRGAVPDELPGMRRGWFAIQDQASAFVVRALDPRPGHRILDACAAPGGKAAHIACLVGPSGSLVAGDVSPGRANLVRGHLARLGVRGYVIVHDAVRPAVRGPFDAVLVDAPCSGLGAARRRPELLWRVPGGGAGGGARRVGLSALARRQVAIASACAELVRPGGRLVYSVCTFARAETDTACDAILRRRPDLVPEAIDGPAGRAERVRLWPDLHGTDGMFVAAFRRSRRAAG